MLGMVFGIGFTTYPSDIVAHRNHLPHREFQAGPPSSGGTRPRACWFQPFTIQKEDIRRLLAVYVYPSAKFVCVHVCVRTTCCRIPQTDPGARNNSVDGSIIWRTIGSEWVRQVKNKESIGYQWNKWTPHSYPSHNPFRSKSAPLNSRKTKAHSWHWW